MPLLFPNTIRSYHTSEENKAINAYFLISSNAQFLDQLRLSRQRSNRCKKPAVSIDALLNIVGCGAINKKLRFVVDIFHSLHATNTLKRLDTGWLFRIIKGGKGIQAGQIKEAIVVFLVET